jgi:hypothetical protein
LEVLIEGKTYTEIYKDKNTLFLTSKAVMPHKSLKIFGQLNFFHPAILIHHLIKSKKTGELSIKLRSHRKVIYFSQGNIINAVSSDNENRLGNLVVKHGYLTKDQIEHLITEIPKKVLLGKNLVERKILTPRQLFELVHEQAKNIVLAAVNPVELDGNFMFFENIQLKDETYKLTLDINEIINHLKVKIDELSQ